MTHKEINQVFYKNSKLFNQSPHKEIIEQLIKEDKFVGIYSLAFSTSRKMLLDSDREIYHKPIEKDINLIFGLKDNALEKFRELLLPIKDALVQETKTVMFIAKNLYRTKQIDDKILEEIYSLIFNIDNWKFEVLDLKGYTIYQKEWLVNEFKDDLTIWFNPNDFIMSLLLYKKKYGTILEPFPLKAKRLIQEYTEQHGIEPNCATCRFVYDEYIKFVRFKELHETEELIFFNEYKRKITGFIVDAKQSNYPYYIDILSVDYQEKPK